MYGKSVSQPFSTHFYVGVFSATQCVSHSISVYISLRGNHFTCSCIFIVCMCGMKFRSLLFYPLGTKSPWGGITLRHIVYTAFQSSLEGLSTSCPQWWFAWECVLYWPNSPPCFLAGIFSLSTTSTFTLILESASKKKKKSQTKTPGLIWPHNQTQYELVAMPALYRHYFYPRVALCVSLAWAIPKASFSYFCF